MTTKMLGTASKKNEVLLTAFGIRRITKATVCAVLSLAENCSFQFARNH